MSKQKKASGLTLNENDLLVLDLLYRYPGLSTKDIFKLAGAWTDETSFNKRIR